MSAPAGASRPGDRLRPATEVALAFVTVAAIVSMHRLFVDGSYRGALVLQAVVAHAVVTLLRRAGVRPGVAATATAGAAVLVISWTRFAETTAWGLPTAGTASALADDLATAWTVFSRVEAPAPVENGFVVVTAAFVWIIALLADWAAFRARATFEAVLPAATLFVFAAALGGDGSPIAGAALFSVAVLAYLLLQGTADQERTTRWAGGRGRRGRGSLVATGIGLGAVAVAAGAVAGPRLPGADADPVISLQDLDEEDEVRQVPSPIVSLQTKLVEQPNIEMFTVRSGRASYWRLTSLDEFDGEIWRSSYSTDEVDGDLPQPAESVARTDTVTQQVTIEALSSVWLPAAFAPAAVEPAPGQSVVFDESSGTLMVDKEVATSDGYSYTVTSEIGDWSAEELRTASADVPGEIADRYSGLPADFPDQASDLAAALTASAVTPYDKALALQDHLRGPRFTYDKEVGPGHSTDALLTFLFVTRRGYCEQFAGAFAALARSVGLPARVAVGFTPGVQDEDDPTLFRVRGTHAHAWPEVYLGEYGWVPFEPTVDRGPPRGRGWLGVGEQQDTSTGGPAVTDPAGVGTGRGDGGGEAPLAPGDAGREAGAGLVDGSGTGGAGDGGDALLTRVVADGAPAVGIGLLAYVALVPPALVVQQVVRRRRARSPAARIRLGWRRTNDAAGEAGVRLEPWMTIAERAGTLAAAYPTQATALAAVARRMEQITFAAESPTDRELAAVERQQAEILAEVHRGTSRPRRVLRWLDVRRLLAPSHRRRMVAGEAAQRAA